MEELKFTREAEYVLSKAEEFAQRRGDTEVGTEHLMYGLLAVPGEASEILTRFGVDDRIWESIYPKGFLALKNECFWSPRCRHILMSAGDYVKFMRRKYIAPTDILLELLKLSEGIAINSLRTLKVDINALMRTVAAAGKASAEAAPDKNPGGAGASEQAGHGVPLTATDLFGAFFPDLNKTMAARPKKPVASSAVGGQLPKKLLDIGVDVTARAREGKLDPVIGRKEEIERIIQILCRKTKNNPVIIGEPGVGKSAVVEGLALAIASGDVPEQLADKIIFSLEMGSLMAGTRYRGDMEEKLKDCVDTIVNSKNIVVFIDEIHTLAAAGGDRGEVKPADMLKPYLARGELQTIGATTLEEYKKHIEKDKALERRFQPVTVNPPSAADTLEILKGLRPNYEKFHNIKITDAALDAAVTLSDRYIMDRFLPDKAIDLIDEAASRKKVGASSVPPAQKALIDKLNRLRAEYKNSKDKDMLDAAASLKKQIDAVEAELAKLRAAAPAAEIGEEEIAVIVSKWTGIPVSRLSASEKEKLLGLEDVLHKRVVGQDEAVSGVCKAIRRARAGLKSPNRPIGSFIFLGPTGVGKTELCKALAEAMFDDENMTIRLDMSEYMESHSISKMIGSPPGYVGYEEGGQLTEQVRRKPYSVVLFDEIEKAHPDVFNMLLQILEDGRLTDSQGRVVSFKNTVIIMTSNAGVAELKSAPRSLGFSDAASDAARGFDRDSEFLMNALKKKFKPEFLNRVDRIVVFKPLDKEQIRKISVKLLNGVTAALSGRDLEIDYTPALIDMLAEKGYDPEYGARPLKRLIEQQVVDPLAEKLLEGGIAAGKVTIGWEDGLTFDTKHE
ncbi:MAG: ATP-dependent Clp protease ATP-binding subunit [Firmicutes bacterium]|nr:ATP-dependent Clp protease ATP-binding subunit [Bacillota bacterium]